MKKLLVVLVLALLPACSMFQPVQQMAVPQNLSETGREAAKLINEAKVDLIAANNTITSQVTAGVMQRDDAQALAQKVDEYWIKVKLFQVGMERSTIITKLEGVPPEKYPDILDAMYAESKAARDAAIVKAPS